jgi:hypothetical protein
LSKFKKDSLIPIILIFSVLIIGFGIFYLDYLDLNSQKYNLSQEIFVEIDYYGDHNYSHLETQMKAIWGNIGVNASFVFSQDINDSLISFDLSNVSQFSFISNSTKDFDNSIHVLITDYIQVKGLMGYWGYAPRSSAWFNAFNNSNSLNSSFTSCIIAASQVLEDSSDEQVLLKVIMHELGHLLHCSHSSTGIMAIGNHKNLYFSEYSILQMNFNQIWSRDIGFNYYL